MKISLRLRFTEPRELRELVTTAEGVGLHGVWISEPWGYDAAPVLGWCAAHTSTIQLGTHIASIFARTPAATAGMAASLASISDGRFRLGLGTSGPAVVEAWHGAEFTKPIARTRDAIAIIRQVLSGGYVDYAGTTVSAPLAGSGRKPLRFAGSTGAYDVPIYLGALGPANQQLTAEQADGWTPTPYSPDHHAAFASDLDAALADNGRRVQLAPVAPIAMGGDLPALWDLERKWSAFYLGAMGEFYARAATRMGFGDMISRVRKLWTAGQRAAAASAVEDSYADAIGLFGPAPRIRERLERYSAAGMDEVVLELRRRDLDDRLSDLRAIGALIEA
jgi:F420-dependent oxidoreductase-like protein